MRSRLFNLAMLRWRSGTPLAADHAMSLAAEGYDVPRLEARYLKA